MLIRVIRDEVNRIMTENNWEKVVKGVAFDVTPTPNDLLEGETLDPYTQTASVRIDNKTVLTDIKNKSGQILTDGNSVRIYAVGGNLKRSYIGIRGDI